MDASKACRISRSYSPYIYTSAVALYFLFIIPTLPYVIAFCILYFIVASLVSWCFRCFRCFPMTQNGHGDGGSSSDSDDNTPDHAHVYGFFEAYIFPNGATNVSALDYTIGFANGEAVFGGFDENNPEDDPEAGPEDDSQNDSGDDLEDD